MTRALDRAAGRRGYGFAGVPWKFTHPHHILHKYQTATASAWPVPGDVVSRETLSTAIIDRLRRLSLVAAVEIFRP
jgi:hypothetical protein